jgi:hypothetical protein
MYRADLSSIDDRALPKGCLAVGWLDVAVPYSTGPTPPAFRKKLEELSWLPVRLTRGFHECGFCGGKPARGNGEIHITGEAGEIFVAPMMIAHYVEAHEYRPPDRFIAAVERHPDHVWPNRSPDLSDRIRDLAANPSPESLNAFYRVFARSQVGVLPPQQTGATAVDAERRTIAEITCERHPKLLDGTPVVIVWADCENQRASDPNRKFVDFPTSEIVAYAFHRGASIVVNGAPPGAPKTVTIPKEEVFRLASEWQIPRFGE